MAVRTTVDVYTENCRTVSIIESQIHGKVAYVSIGAMLVGSVRITAQVGNSYKDKIIFDADLLTNSASSLETLCKMGNSLGRKRDAIDH